MFVTQPNPLLTQLAFIFPARATHRSSSKRFHSLSTAHSLHSSICTDRHFFWLPSSSTCLSFFLVVAVPSCAKPSQLTYCHSLLPSCSPDRRMRQCNTLTLFSERERERERELVFAGIVYRHRCICLVLAIGLIIAIDYRLRQYFISSAMPSTACTLDLPSSLLHFTPASHLQLNFFCRHLDWRSPPRAPAKRNFF